VLTGGKVDHKELIRLEINLPDGRLVYLWSEVVDEAEDIGFAVKFTSVSEEDQESLDQFIRLTLAAS